MATTQPYSVYDAPEGRVFNYVKPTEGPQPDRVSHTYSPPDPGQSRGWAFNAVVGACIGAAFIGVGLAALAILATVALGIPPRLGMAGMFAGLVLPFAWPFAWPWRGPFRAYQDTLDTWEQVGVDYHDAAIERLRNRPPPTLHAPHSTPHVPRALPDAGEMFYLKCAAVLARATVDPSAPRNASLKIRTVTSDGVQVIITKDEYKDVAGMLCELGFMVGGEGQEPRAYALAERWEDTEVPDLLRALRACKAEIVERVG